MDPQWEGGAEALLPSINGDAIDRSMGRGAGAGVDFSQVARMLVKSTAMRGGVVAAQAFWMRLGSGAGGLAGSLRRVVH